MSLFGNNQTLSVRLPEKIAGGPGEYRGQLLFQRDQEIALRLVEGPGLEELTGRIAKSAAHGTGMQVEYRQGNYLCSFTGRFDLVADRSLPVSLLLIMPKPGSIRRVLDPV